MTARPESPSHDGEDAALAVVPAPPNKQQRGKRKAPNGALSRKKPQSKTLDMWFKPTSNKRAVHSNNNKKGSIEDASGGRKDRVMPQDTTPSQKKHASTAPSSKKKPLTQRRIHINDLCRVCEAVRTEESSRCELRCLSCDMTVHKKCYGIKEELPDRDWNCRRCQYVINQTNGKQDGDNDYEQRAVESNKPSTEIEFPSHEALPTTHKYHELHQDCNFATVYLFLKRFRRLGLQNIADLTIENLACALVSPKKNQLIRELHLSLLATANATLSKNHNWSGNIIRFLKHAEYAPATDYPKPSACDRNSSDDDQNTFYYELTVSERVQILKFLCETQFEHNDTLIERIDDEDVESLRDNPIGTDADGRSNWVLEDPSSAIDGTAWICRCAQSDGSAWETVCDDLETLESLVKTLSLSTATRDLQLWQKLSDGVLKSLIRRHKKKQQAADRLARMPRLLGSSELDWSAIVGDSSGGRSLRTKRVVSYRELIEDEEEEESNASNSSGNSDDGDSDGSDSESSAEDEDNEKAHSSNRKRKRAFPTIPTRSSRRLRRSSPSPARHSDRPEPKVTIDEEEDSDEDDVEEEEEEEEYDDEYEEA